MAGASVMGPNSGFRARLFKAVHAEGVKRGLDHDAMHDMCQQRYGVRSMSDLTDEQLLAVFRGWTGKMLKRRNGIPKRGAAKEDELQMVSGEDLIALDQEFAIAGISGNGRQGFIRRQLRGRDVIRTRSDFARVFRGVEAMNRRNDGRGRFERGAERSGHDDGRRGGNRVVVAEGGRDHVAPAASAVDGLGRRAESIPGDLRPGMAGRGTR